MEDWSIDHTRNVYPVTMVTSGRWYKSSTPLWP